MPFLLELFLDTISQEPGPSGAVLQGILFGRTAPHRSQRSTFQVPALVIGHPRDPIHPFSDADMLARELPNARLIGADSVIELRLRPGGPLPPRSPRSSRTAGAAAHNPEAGVRRSATA